MKTLGFTLIVSALACAQEPAEVEGERDRAVAGTQLPPRIPADTQYRLSVGGKLKYHVQDMYDPEAVFRSAVAAGIDFVRNDPPEWGQGVQGWGTSFASRMGQRAVKGSIMWGVESAAGWDPRPVRITSHGFMPRARDAIRNTLMARRDAGGQTFNWARLAGNYGSAFVSRTWNPPTRSSAGDALVSGSVGLGMDVGLSVVYEFWPDLRRAMHLGK